MTRRTGRLSCWLAVAALSITSACANDTGQSEQPLAGGMSGGTFATQGGTAAPPTGGMGISTAGTMASGGIGGGGVGGGGVGGVASGGTGGVGGMNACATGALDTDTDGSPDCDDACPADAMKTEAGECGCGEPEPMQVGGACSPDGGVPAEDLCIVGPITDELREIHGEVYTRYAAARGVPALATDAPADEALRRACMLLYDLGQRPDILEVMLEEDIGLVVMAESETSADFPEFAAWGVPDSRARGLGGVPRGLCAEENVMCNRSVDRWRGESICVHEFAHTMHLGVYNKMESDFNSRVQAAFRAATSAGKYSNTYAASNATEYFGEGVQNWYNTNIESIPANGVHNEINTRAEMEEYDPGLYEILAEVLPDEPGYKDCYYYDE